MERKHSSQGKARRSQEPSSPPRRREKKNSSSQPAKENRSRWLWLREDQTPPPGYVCDYEPATPRRPITRSQPIPSTSTYDMNEEPQRSQGVSNLNLEQEPGRSQRVSVLNLDDEKLAHRVIRYLFAVDGGKQLILKSRIMKNVFEGQGKQFHRTIIKVKEILSKIFGYRLVDIDAKKYMLVNEIKNTLPHINHTKEDKAQLVLLHIILTHIFMSEESCSEELIFDFLQNLGIITSENFYHDYFGNIKELINEVFVTQGYLEKVPQENNNTQKIEYKWGPRAEYEFSRRSALEFVSKMYNGRPLNSWPLQYKALIAIEKIKQQS